MVECLVEYEYIAQEEDELTIRPGEIINNVQKMDGGWWEGEVRGKKGMFPDNFVKEVKQEAKKPPPENNRASVKKVAGGGGGGHVAELANKLGKEGGIRIGPPGQPALKRDISQGKRQQRVKVTFSYSPENDDELRLEVGDIVTVTKQEEEGWWEGVLNGKTGMFPSNFVEVIEEESAEVSGDELNTPEGEVIEIHGKKVKGVGLGNIFSAGPIKLRSAGSKDQPLAEKRAPTSPKGQAPKEPLVQENMEKRDSLKRGTAPTEPPPSLPPKDQPPVKPLEDSYGYAVPYSENDEDTDTCESANGRSYSPGRIVIEGDEASVMNNCLVPSNDSSLPELNIASPESSCSLELGKASMLSSSSLSSGPLSARSENVSDDVPYELSALSHARHTPPPRFTQFNFRKRRSRGTPKNSPKVNMLSIKEVVRKNSDEKPPEKVAKLVGTDDRDVANTEDDRAAMASTESQTDAEFVEDQETVDLMPQNVIIKAFARSKSEPCLATSKKSVSFVTRDNYISDSEEAGEMKTPISDGAKKRMSRAKRRFPSKGLIDASKITDSLKLLRVRLGLDGDGTAAEGTEQIATLKTDIEVKTKHKTLATIRNKIIRKIASSPVRSNKGADGKSDLPVTPLSNANIGDTGIRVTEDNCSTTALRGSPLSTRSSSIQEIEGAEEADVRNKSTSLLLNSPSTTTETTMSVTKQNKDVSSVQRFFSFTLGRRKFQKNKIQVAKINDEQIEHVTAWTEENRARNVPQQSYFQTLDNMGKMSPAIRNIGNKYKLFDDKNHEVSIPDDQEKENYNVCNMSYPTNTKMGQYSTTCEIQRDLDQGAGKAALRPARSDLDISLQPLKTLSQQSNEDIGESSIFTTEMESRETSGIYAPNEGDQNKPLIKRTKKSTNVSIGVKELDVRKPNAKRPSSQKKPLKKTNSITQRLRRIWSSRDKMTKSDQEVDIKGETSSESVEESKNDTREHTSQGRRDKLITHSDTTTAQTGNSEQYTALNEMTTSKSADAIVHPVSESSASEDSQLKVEPTQSPRNVNQNCENSQMEAIFKLQNFVHSFTQSENDVSYSSGYISPTNVEPTIRRKEIAINAVKVSTSSSTSTPEPFLESEDANLEFPIPVYEKENGTTSHVEYIEMDVAEEEERKDVVNGEGKSRKPRRIHPVKLQHESMQTDPVDPDNDDVFEAETARNEKSLQKETCNTSAMHCQSAGEGKENVFHLYDKKPDSFEQRQIYQDVGNKLERPTLSCRAQELGSMEMEITNEVDNKTVENKKDEALMKKKSRWTRNNSAPALEEKKPNSLPRVNTAPLHPNDSSLDKWDMMKLILEETQAIYLAEFGNLDLESPRPVPLSAQQAQRPFDYDESLSASSSASTASASETKDMETGDLENDSGEEGGFRNIADEMNKAFVAVDRNPYSSAPVPSPINSQETRPNITDISVSSLSSSLNKIEAFCEKGGSGEKRKQSEVATPTKDEQRGRKVRLESPESDDEGPPRARRVLRPEK